MDLPLEPWTWTALWPYAATIIVLGARAFYHFVAPVNWREWAGAGLFQAFVIALYAEMHGFPLTLCVLAGFVAAGDSATAHQRPYVRDAPRPRSPWHERRSNPRVFVHARRSPSGGEGLGQNLLFERRPR
jgi:hypothetical protein